MATNNKRISELTAVTELATGDQIPVVDVSDTTDASTGTTKNVTFGNAVASPIPHLTASRGVLTDANKKFISDVAATGTGAPVRATSPTLVTPALGTPASGDLQNCTAATTSAKGVSEIATPTESVAGSSTTLVNTPSGAAAQIAVHTNPKQMAQGVNMTAAASGSTGITVADNDNIDFGTRNYTLRWKGIIADYTPSADVILMQKTDATNGWLLQVDTTGVLQLLRNAEAAKSSTAAPSIFDGTAHEILCVVTTETASVAGSVVFYCDGYIVGTSVAITAGAPTTVNNAVSLYVMGTSAVRSAGTTFAATTFNRALTAAEVLDLYRNGIAEADKWGSQTAIISPTTLNGGFETAGGGAPDVFGSWVEAVGYGSIADETSLVYEGSHAAKLGFLTGAAYMTQDVSVAGARTVRFSFFARGDGSVAGQYRLYDLTNGAYIYNATSTGITGTTYTYVSKETVLPANCISVRVSILSPATVGVAYFDNILLEKIGATLCLLPEGIQPAPGQWLDSSSNKLHAWQPATGSSLTRYKNTFEIRGKNTWAGTHEAQSITMLTDASRAMLPVDCYITDIIGVITGSTIEDIIIGDGSDTDRWVEITTGLAAGTVAFTVANRISDGTNYEMVVDPDANFTGSIEWTIRGIIID